MGDNDNEKIIHLRGKPKVVAGTAIDDGPPDGVAVALLRSCAMCRHARLQGKKKDSDPDVLICTRYPPHPFDAGDLLAVFPIVAETTCCGEFDLLEPGPFPDPQQPEGKTRA